MSKDEQGRDRAQRASGPDKGDGHLHVCTALGRDPPHPRALVPRSAGGGDGHRRLRSSCGTGGATRSEMGEPYW